MTTSQPQAQTSRQPLRLVEGTTSDIGPRSDLTSTVYAIVGELMDKFAGAFSSDELEECVDRAVRDLRGSICIEALPEMSIRLASVRLTALASGQTGPTESAATTADGFDHSAMP